MPFATGGMKTHNDDYHTGSAKRGAANGVTPLDASTEVPMANLKTGGANELCALDASAKIPVSNLPSVDITSTGNTWNTTYQNTSGKRRLVIITIRVKSSLGSTEHIYYKQDASSPPTTTLHDIQGQYSYDTHATIVSIVPNNEYYRLEIVQTTDASILSWVEIDF